MTSTITADGFTSKAIRAYDEQAPAVESQIEAAKVDAAQRAEAMSRAALVKAIKAHPLRGKPVSGSAPKPELVARFVNLEARAADATKALHALNMAAHADRGMVASVNAAAEAAADKRAKLVEYASDPKYMTWIAQQAQDVAVADAYAGYMARVAGKVNAGHDIVEVTRATAQSAIQDVLSAVKSAVSSGFRPAEIAAAEGSRRFAHTVAMTYGMNEVAMTVEISYLV